MAVIFTLNLAGCAQVQRKFTRKKKLTKIPHYHPVRPYEKSPVPELYQKHYVYWQSWHSELLQVIGDNYKKDRRCISEAISNLRDMQTMLVPEKSAELGKIIAKLETVRAEIEKGGPSGYNTVYLRDILESQGCKVTTKFRYVKVKDCLVVGDAEGDDT
jgi:GH15 family glucan-1,4-alpha-glucosidase